MIFDVDGTLVDSVDLHAETWQRVLAEFGVEAPFDQVRAQIGKGTDTLLPVFLPEDARREHGEAMSRRRGQLFQAEYLDRVRPFDHVRELFARLRADGIRVALASSGQAEEVAHHQKLLHVTDLVDATTTSQDAEKSKPHPDIFAAALQKLGETDPTRIWVVGDTPYDVEAAGKLSLPSVALLCGGFAEEDLRRAGALSIYRDPADLLAHYAQVPFAAALRAA